MFMSMSLLDEFYMQNVEEYSIYEYCYYGEGAYIIWGVKSVKIIKYRGMYRFFV